MNVSVFSLMQQSYLLLITSGGSGTKPSGGYGHKGSRFNVVKVENDKYGRVRNGNDPPKRSSVIGFFDGNTLNKKSYKH